MEELQTQTPLAIQATNRVHARMLFVILVVGAMLRLCTIHENVWVDELHTAWTVSADSHAELIHRARLGNNSPVYFWIVRRVTQLLGMHAWTLRLVSVIAGCALIPLTFWLVRAWKCSLTASVLAAALVAIDRRAIFYSMEARPYVLVQLVAVFHLFLFSRLLTKLNHVWVWIAWVLTGILMFQLHCTAALIFSAEVVAFVLLRYLRREAKLDWIYFAIGLMVIGLGMLPSYGLLHEVAARRRNWDMFVQRSTNPLRILTFFPLYLYGLSPLLVALAVFVAKRLRMRSPVAETIDDQSEEPASIPYFTPLVVTCAWVLVPISVAWVATARDAVRLLFPRYLIATTIALAPITALLVSQTLTTRRPRRWGSLVILLLAIGTISPARYINYGFGALLHSSENWRSPVAMINREPASVPVILYSGLIEAEQWSGSVEEGERQYCELPLRGLYPIHEQQTVISLGKNTPLKLADDAKRMMSQTGAWLIIRGTDKTAAQVQGKVMSNLDGEFVGEFDGEFEITQSEDFGGVHLRRLRPTN